MHVHSTSVLLRITGSALFVAGCVTALAWTLAIFSAFDRPGLANWASALFATGWTLAAMALVVALGIRTTLSSAVKDSRRAPRTRTPHRASLRAGAGLVLIAPLVILGPGLLILSEYFRNIEAARRSRLRYRGKSPSEATQYAAIHDFEFSEPSYRAQRTLVTLGLRGEFTTLPGTYRAKSVAAIARRRATVVAAVPPVTFAFLGAVLFPLLASIRDHVLSWLETLGTSQVNAFDKVFNPEYFTALGLLLTLLLILTFGFRVQEWAGAAISALNSLAHRLDPAQGTLSAHSDNRDQEATP